jgi:hypothetical protein
MDLQSIADLINSMFIKLFPSNGLHPYLIDMLRVEKLRKKRLDILRSELEDPPKFKYEGHNELPLVSIDCIKEPTLLSEPAINKIYDLMQKIESAKELKEILKMTSHFSIPTTVKTDLNHLLSDFRKSTSLNILIIGGGPQGLFLASYLDRIYKSKTGFQSTTPINVCVIDNRRLDKTVREPYIRLRHFLFSSNYFSYIFPRIYSWDNSEKTTKFIPINQLELILYVNCYKNKIPIYFLNELPNLSDYHSIIHQGRFDVVFDCSGGNLNTNFIVKQSWFTDAPLKKTQGNYTFVENLPNNSVYLTQPKSGFPKNTHYVEIRFIGSNKKDEYCFMMDMVELELMSFTEVEYFSHFCGKKYYQIDDLKLIIENIKSSYERANVERYYQKYRQKKIVFMVIYFKTFTYHSIKVSHVMSVSGRQILYIGAGDTIMRGHFITGSGLNRTIDFSVKCANMLPLIDSLKRSKG